MPARFLRFVCLLLGLAILCQQPSFAAPPRLALVVGNSEYGPEIGRLKNPVNDAKLMADTLKGLGFQVDLVLDADQRAMKRAVKGFGAKLREAGRDATGLFYYAGHGVQVGGVNFLLPVGAEIADEADVEIESVAADDVMTQMQSAGNAVNLVFLDACRNNPLARMSRSATRGLARLDAPRGSFVGYSTAPGDVAADGEGANSPYAQALAEALKTPGISVEEAHRNVRAKVLAASNNTQTPWDSSSLTGPVILVERPVVPEPAAPQPLSAPAPQPQVPQQAAIDKEALFWDTVKDSSNAAEFEAYLKKFPDGTFADLARAKIEALQKPVAAAPAPVPAADPAPAPPEAAAEASPAPKAATLRVSRAVEAELQVYLRNVGLTSRYWAFAISKDGTRAERVGCSKSKADGSRWCSGPAGITSQEITDKGAVMKCGSDCMLLYRGKDKVSDVELVAN